MLGNSGLNAALIDAHLKPYLKMRCSGKNHTTTDNPAIIKMVVATPRATKAFISVDPGIAFERNLNNPR